MTLYAVEVFPSNNDQKQQLLRESCSTTGMTKKFPHLKVHYGATSVSFITSSSSPPLSFIYLRQQQTNKQTNPTPCTRPLLCRLSCSARFLSIHFIFLCQRLHRWYVLVKVFGGEKGVTLLCRIKPEAVCFKRIRGPRQSQA